MHRVTRMVAAGLLALLLAVPSAFATDSTSGAASDAAAAQPQVGEIPPDALGKDRDGKPITVSQHRGKVLILTFWASWCSPCRKELPELARLKAIIGEDALEVVAVNFKESRPEFNSVVRANRKLPINFVPDPGGAISDTYRVSGLPNMFVINAEGRIAHVHRGYSADMLPGFLSEIVAMLPLEIRSRPPRVQ